MRIRVATSRVLDRAALVILMAATAAGCGSSNQLNRPLLTDSTEKQQEVIGNSQPDGQIAGSADLQSPTAAGHTVPQPRPVRVAKDPDKTDDTLSGVGPEQNKVAKIDIEEGPEPSSVEPPSVDITSFRWPVHGRIISSFGASPGGNPNEGINLAVPEGTIIKAAEAGTVLYSGDGVEGYGKLVLIRHSDGWVSAYAHNSKIEVKKGDAVSRGQTIAAAGMTGSVSSPQLHFELRKDAKPVNPLDYLADS